MSADERVYESSNYTHVSCLSCATVDSVGTHHISHADAQPQAHPTSDISSDDRDRAMHAAVSRSSRSAPDAHSFLSSALPPIHARACAFHLTMCMPHPVRAQPRNLRLFSSSPHPPPHWPSTLMMPCARRVSSDGRRPMAESSAPERERRASFSFAASMGDLQIPAWRTSSRAGRMASLELSESAMSSIGERRTP